MILYTVQSLLAYEPMKRRKELYCTECYSPDFEDAYRWMIFQMKLRIGLPLKENRWPIWAWTEMPELGKGFQLGPGNRGICIEFEVDKRTVLISDFVAWHCVLNNQPYGESTSERRKYRSWRNIFDLKRIDKAQVTLWSVPMSAIREITFFEECTQEEFECNLVT